MRRRRKLLVVMEDGSVRRLLAGALSLGGYDVSVAGREATDLGAHDREQLNLILYDVSLLPLPAEGTPCRSRVWGAGARIVAFSDPPTAEMARRARDLGAREYVGDPFDLSTLLRVIADNARSVPTSLPAHRSAGGRGRTIHGGSASGTGAGGRMDHDRCGG
jgi:DNA-binding response OmpR family regulator